jgi:hypothetical protein
MTYSLFPTNPTPGAFANDGVQNVLGVVFESSEAGSVSAVRFYLHSGGQMTAREVGIFANDGSNTLLGSGTDAPESDQEDWIQVSLGSSVSISAGVSYVAAVETNGIYGYTNSVWPVTSGPLTGVASGSDPNSIGNGRYVEPSSGMEYPSSASAGRNYYVDIVFTPSASGSLLIPTLHGGFRGYDGFRN